MNKSPTSLKPAASTQNHLDSHASHYFARLMTPTQVADATSGQSYEVRQSTAGHWVLAGDISAEMFTLLQNASRHLFPVRLTGFFSSCGIAYCSIVHQVEGHQSRLVLPLYDPSVRKFLESMTNNQKVTFSLGNNDHDEAILLPCPLKPIEFIPLLSMSCSAGDDEQREALNELPLLLPAIGNLLQVPSLFGSMAVRHVSVSLLMPSILDKCFRSFLTKAATT